MSDEDNAGSAQVLLAVARIEGKIDVITERLGTLAKDSSDHEQRLRALEQRPAGVTIRTLCSVLVGAITSVGTLVSIFYYLTK